MNINEGTITYEFYNLLKEISTSNYSISPSSFKDTFGRKHRKFNNYAQHDSQEFLRHLLEDISSEMNLSRSKVFRELDTKEKSLIVLNEEYHKLFLERENSIILDIFYGQFCNTFECNKCNYKTYSFEKFIDIPILLGKEVYN
jgi:ubiquitin C-terminal hydrolase